MMAIARIAELGVDLGSGRFSGSCFSLLLFYHHGCFAKMQKLLRKVLASSHHRVEPKQRIHLALAIDFSSSKSLLTYHFSTYRSPRYRGVFAHH